MSKISDVVRLGCGFRGHDKFTQHCFRCVDLTINELCMVIDEMSVELERLSKLNPEEDQPSEEFPCHWCELSRRCEHTRIDAGEHGYRCVQCNMFGIKSDIWCAAGHSLEVINGVDGASITSDQGVI